MDGDLNNDLNNEISKILNTVGQKNEPRLSDEELEARIQHLQRQIDARKAEKAQRVADAREAVNRQIFDQREMLLTLMKHSRTSCSDENPVNGDFIDAGCSTTRQYVRCHKCALMGLDAWNLRDVVLRVDVTVEHA